MKLRMFMSVFWNKWDVLALILFFIGAVIRYDERYLKDANIIYVVDIIFWNFRVLEILSVNQYLGPYVKIIAKLVSYSY